jgi:S1-C subfamily serine protease
VSAESRDRGVNAFPGQDSASRDVENSGLQWADARDYSAAGAAYLERQDLHMRTLGHLVCCLALSCSICASRTAVAAEDGIRKSVVKIYVTRRNPDFVRPWKKQDPTEVSGSGVIIESKRILTNAHVVNYASQVFVEADHAASKRAATVQFVAPDIDLALITIDDPAFFEEHPPLARTDKLPRVEDAVHVYGYPEGGQDLSITKGIVSRIEFDAIYYDTRGLRIQVDAAINPGNSGGPALVGDRMIGLSFSRLQQSDNIGYLIANEEIELFLKDVADGKYDGKPAIYEHTQTLENEALRGKLKLGNDTTGVLVWKPDRPEASYPLKPWDVITKIGDHAIDNSGMVRVGENLRLNFRYFVQSLARDGAVHLGVVRDGQRVEVDLPVSAHRERLFPYCDAYYPSFFVWGPLVFSTATDDLIDVFSSPQVAMAWFSFFTYRGSPMVTRRGDRPAFQGEEVVVLLDMFPHRTTKGYEKPNYYAVAQVNGTPIRNLRHLAETLRDTADVRVAISFVEKETPVLVFDRREILDASDDILSENGIRKICSDDLKGVWEGKK